MFISRERFDTLLADLATTRAALDKERQAVVLLERALASAQANVEWLRVMTNQLSLDRAAIAASKGLTLPTPEVAGRVQTAADVLAQLRAREAGGGAPASPDVDTVVEQLGAALAADDVDAALAVYSGVMQGFEDVGDEAAEDLGITHTPDGEVEYRG